MTTIYNRPDDKEKRRALRQSMGQPERLVWQRLRDRQLSGTKFRRQYSVGPYVLDFYAPSLKLVIEIDGDSHAAPGAEAHDRRRAEYIESFGIRFLRFTNTDVCRNLDGVMAAIAQKVVGLPGTSPNPSLVRRGTGPHPALPSREQGRQ